MVLDRIACGVWAVAAGPLRGGPTTGCRGRAVERRRALLASCRRAPEPARSASRERSLWRRRSECTSLVG